MSTIENMEENIKNLESEIEKLNKIINHNKIIMKKLGKIINNRTIQLITEWASSEYYWIYGNRGRDFCSLSPEEKDEFKKQARRTLFKLNNVNKSDNHNEKIRELELYIKVITERLIKEYAQAEYYWKNGNDHLFYGMPLNEQTEYLKDAKHSLIVDNIIKDDTKK